MDGAAVAKRQASAERHARRLRSRAAEARREAAAARRRSEEACDRLAEALARFPGHPFGDQGASFRLRIGRCRPLVRFVRHDLRRWLERSGLPPEAVAEVALACSEACANAVEHAREASRHLVEVAAAFEGSELQVRIRDFGTWNEQAGSEFRGRGLDMIRDLMGSLEVRRRPDGTEVVMRRPLAA